MPLSVHNESNALQVVILASSILASSFDGAAAASTSSDDFMMASNASTTLLDGIANDYDDYDDDSGDNNNNIRFPLYLRATATTVCLLLLCCGLPGNCLVPFVVLKTKDLRNSTNIFLINLSISDLLFLLVTSPPILIELHSRPEVWSLGLFMCKAVSFIEICVAHCSILTMLAISFERFYAICRPLEAGYKCTKRRAFLVILLIWITSLISCIPMLFITELQQTEYIDGSVVPVCVNTLQISWHRIYFIVIFVLFFVVPFVILLLLYAIISRKLTADSKSIPNLSNCKRRHQVRRQVVLMLASVCITFFICLLPFRLLTLWIIMSTQAEIISLGLDTFYILLFSCRLLLYVNSSINPILYNVISCKFRAAFCKVLKHDMRIKAMTAANTTTSRGQGRESCISDRCSNTNTHTGGDQRPMTVNATAAAAVSAAAATCYTTIISRPNNNNNNNNNNLVLTVSVQLPGSSLKLPVTGDGHSL